MTSTTWLPDLEEELLPRPEEVPAAPVLASAPVAPQNKATGPGIAEIKKHNKKGIYKGLAQLRRSSEPVRRPRYLVTYLPCDPNGTASPAVVTDHVRVFVIAFPPQERRLKNNLRAWTPTVPVPTTRLIRGPWFDLGVLKLAKTPALGEAKTEAQFGDAVEPQVRSLFIRKVVVPRSGGRKPTPHDIVWDELAGFYSELARELAAESASFRF